MPLSFGFVAASLTAPFLMLGGSALAAPLSLSAVREVGTGLEKVTVIFKEDKVELVANSNFLSPALEPIRLGHFQMPKTPYWAGVEERIEFEARKQRMRSEERETLGLRNLPTRPHRVRIEVGSEELSESAATLREDFMAVLRKALSDPAWRAVDGIAVFRKETECFKAALKKPCPVSRFGSVY